MSTKIFVDLFRRAELPWDEPRDEDGRQVRPARMNKGKNTALTASRPPQADSI
jgi:hypothetical protein